LDDWDASLSRFIKVMPRDYKRALLDLSAEADASKNVAAE
jgi:glutamate synthase (NADPH) large chain